jgi:FtsZ-binding cell division protein ZapB
MELLTSARIEYLRYASPESLHAEATEWKSDVIFWQEEMSFLYKLLHEKFSQSAIPSIELAMLEKELIDISSVDLLNIKQEVEDHEAYLAQLMRDSMLQSQDSYREQHKEILERIHAVLGRIKDYKTKLFSIVK